MKVLNFLAAALCFALAIVLCITQTILAKSLIVSAAFALATIVMGYVTYLTFDDLKTDRHG